MNTFIVFGNHGELTVDAETGKVEAYDFSNGDSDDYKDILRFDVSEWHNTYPIEPLAGRSLDILDFGFWTDTGAYEAPIRDRFPIHRRELRGADSGRASS